MPPRDSSPGILKLRALLLLIVHTMLKESPYEAEFSQLLHDFQGALASEGLVRHCDPMLTARGNSAASSGVMRSVGSINGAGSPVASMRHQPSMKLSPDLASQLTRGSDVFTLRTQSEIPEDMGHRPSTDWRKHSKTAGMQMQAAFSARDPVHGDAPLDDVGPAGAEMQSAVSEDARACRPPPWRPTLATLDDLFWRCTLLTCDVAHRMLQASSNNTSSKVGGRQEVASICETGSVNKGGLLLEPPGGAGGGGSSGGSATTPSRKTTMIRRTSSMSVSSSPRRLSRESSPMLTSPSGGPGSSYGAGGDGDAADTALFEELLSPGRIAAWEALRRGLAVLKLLVRECVNAMLSEPRPAAASSPTDAGGAMGGAVNGAGPSAAAVAAAAAVGVEAVVGDGARAAGELFRLGGQGLRALCAFLAGPVLTLLPMLHLAAPRLERAASKASEAAGRLPRLPGDAGRGPASARRMGGNASGSEPWEAARVALAELAEELQTVLKELYQGLLGAQWEGFDHLGGSGSNDQAPRVRFFEEFTTLDGVDLEKIRRLVCGNLTSSHRKQLASVEQALRGQMELLKALGIKKRREY